MIRTVVFDLGGVLLDWDPRYLYRDLFKNDERMEHFLGTVCAPAWNHTLDLGRSWSDARQEAVERYPEYTEYIDMYWDRWLDMFSGPIHETVDLLMYLKRKKIPVLALSNWNDVKFQVALEEFPFLRLFDGRIVSGEVRLAKPDPAIYHMLLDTYKLNPRETFFVDDRLENVEAARNLGIEAVQFTSPAPLEKDLANHGLIPEAEAGAGGGCSNHSHDHDHDHDEQAGCGGGGSCHGR